MVDFDRLNRETREYKNNQPVNRDSNNSYKSINYYNNETYKANNGQYSNYYTNYRY